MKPAYSFDLFYKIHARYPHPSLFSLRDNAYYRAFHNGTELSLLKVYAQDNDLTITPHIGTPQLKSIQHVLGIGVNLSTFYEMAQTDKTLWQVVEPLVGLPLYCSENLYEALIFVIIEQHIAWINAQKSQRVLVEWGNNFIEYEGHKHYVTPPPHQLAQATIDDLRPLKITFKRMQLLIDIAQKFVDNPTYLQQPEPINVHNLYNDLLKIKGVGHWTASVVVSRATGIYPFVPHNDVALQAAVSEYFSIEKSAAATQAIFANYGEFAGLAAHFTLMKWVLDKYPIVNG